MGFKMGRTFELTFEGTDLHGAVVKVRSASVKKIADFLDDAAGLKEEVALLAEHLISWNLETEDGEPIPTTVEGIMSLEEPAWSLIAKEWIKATRGITAPLDHRSSDGVKPPEGQIPMEML